MNDIRIGREVSVCGTSALGRTISSCPVEVNPPSQVQQEMLELRGLASNINELTGDLWVRLASVVKQPENNNPTPMAPNAGLVAHALQLRDIVSVLTEAAGSLRLLRQSIEL
jgi:hypothetical protein